MTITPDGQFNPDTAAAIEAAMMQHAKDGFGDDVNDTKLSAIRSFYGPVSRQIAEAQEAAGLILSSAQLEHAEGAALDLVTAIINVRRNLASRATGIVTFSRETAANRDYVIPDGTLVQTGSLSNPKRFVTTESRVLADGTTSVTAPIRSRDGGIEYNVGTGTITVMPNPPTGIEFVTNDQETDGGTNREEDDELRSRARGSLSEGSSATAGALLAAIQNLDGVRSTSIFINSSGIEDGGIPPHSFELIVDGGNQLEIAQTILDTKAAGDNPVGGVNGTGYTRDAELPNKQIIPVSFSRPDVVDVLINIDIEVMDDYAGDDSVRDSITGYIGGLLTSGNSTDGELGAGDDVLFGEIEFAARSVNGVYDVTNLEIGTSAFMTNENNLTVEDFEVALTTADSTAITITTTSV